MLTFPSYFRILRIREMDVWTPLEPIRLIERSDTKILNNNSRMDSYIRVFISSEVNNAPLKFFEQNRRFADRDNSFIARNIYR